MSLYKMPSTSKGGKMKLTKSQAVQRALKGIPSDERFVNIDWRTKTSNHWISNYG